MHKILIIQPAVIYITLESKRAGGHPHLMNLAGYAFQTLLSLYFKTKTVQIQYNHTL